MFSGVVTGSIADKKGWGIVFLLLLIFALLTLISTITYSNCIEKNRKKKEFYSQVEMVEK